MANTIFEKTMQMCLEAKKSVSNNKKLNEYIKKSKLHEQDEEEKDDAVMDDVSDDIVVVIDPDISEDELDKETDELQDIINSTPDGEVPTDDEHVGDYVYSCPICGNKFFSEEEMGEEECPVCGDIPDAFVLVGRIEELDKVEIEDGSEDELEDEPKDELEDEPEDDEFNGAEDDLEINIDSLEDEDIVEECNSLSKKEVKKRLTRKVSEKKAMPKASRGYMINETTFNPFLNKFIRRNYKNTKSFAIVNAIRSGKILTLECVLTFKSGKKKNVKLVCDNFNPAPGLHNFAFREDGTFKSKSLKSTPFVFTVKIDKDRILTCEGLKYNIVTKPIYEGKRLNIYGNLIRKDFYKR